MQELTSKAVAREERARVEFEAARQLDTERRELAVQRHLSRVLVRWRAGSLRACFSAWSTEHAQQAWASKLAAAERASEGQLEEERELRKMAVSRHRQITLDSEGEHAARVAAERRARVAEAQLRRRGAAQRQQDAREQQRLRTLMQALEQDAAQQEERTIELEAQLATSQRALRQLRAESAATEVARQAQPSLRAARAAAASLGADSSAAANPAEQQRAGKTRARLAVALTHAEDANQARTLEAVGRDASRSDAAHSATLLARADEQAAALASSREREQAAGAERDEQELCRASLLRDSQRALLFAQEASAHYARALGGAASQVRTHGTHPLLEDHPPPGPPPPAGTPPSPTAAARAYPYPCVALCRCATLDRVASLASPPHGSRHATRAGWAAPGPSPCAHASSHADWSA